MISFVVVVDVFTECHRHLREVVPLPALRLSELVGVLIGANQTLADLLPHLNDKEEFLLFCEVESLSSDTWPKSQPNRGNISLPLEAIYLVFLINSLKKITILMCFIIE